MNDLEPSFRCEGQRFEIHGNQPENRVSDDRKWQNIVVALAPPVDQNLCSVLKKNETRRCATRDTPSICVPTDGADTIIAVMRSA